MDPTDVTVQTYSYDDLGGVDAEVVIYLPDLELVVVHDKVYEQPKDPRVFWRRPGDVQPRGQLA